MKVSKERKVRTKKKNVKSARLIVRNLSFKCNEQSLKDYFAKFGEVVDLKLLRKGDKLVGCGFVQYQNKLSAAKAISKLSGNDFMGRPIIVDWALPRDKFGKKIDDLVEDQKIVVKKEEPDESFSGENETKPHSTKVSLDNAKEEAAIKSSSEEGDDYCIEESEGESDACDENSSEDGDEVQESEEHILKKPKAEKPQNKQKFKYDPNDVSDGRTVFLKNIPFSVKDDDLVKCAEKLGTVVYGIVCVDSLTEHSKGTGFVKYRDKRIVNALLNGKLTLTINGNKLEPFLALKKKQVDNMKEKKSPKDNRNLYLLREGVIVADSPAAEGVSEGDMAKRLQLEHWKTQTLRNLNKFVSPTRLVIHNIPPFMDDKRLREIFMQHSPKGSVITEVRIMRNLNDINEQGVGRSKGFAFVRFSKHQHSLEALRKINNNPKIFKESKRPIVGFSIENIVALQMKEKRKEKSQVSRNKSIKTTSTDKETFKDNKVFKKRNVNFSSDSLPAFSGNVAKPGMKKVRSRRELSMQAQLHHKSAMERKLLKKKFYYSKKFKSKMKGKSYKSKK